MSSSKPSIDDDGQPVGHIEFDARGNAIWKADREIQTEDTVIRLLTTGLLEMADDTAVAGLSLAHSDAGFDPYSSGAVVRDPPPRKKTDLRALSAEILRKRQAQSDT